MTEMKHIRAKWKGYWLSWFWSGKYWYVTAIDYHTGKRLTKQMPVGSGNTRDMAFNDFNTLLNG